MRGFAVLALGLAAAAVFLGAAAFLAAGFFSVFSFLGAAAFLVVALVVVAFCQGCQHRL